MGSKGWIKWVIVGLAFAYSFPYFPKIHSANELPRVYLTHAIVTEGNVYIDSNVVRWGATSDVSPDGHQCHPRKHHCYSNKAPGSSILTIPALAAWLAIDSQASLAELVWVSRTFGAALPTFLFLFLVFGFLRDFVSARVAWLVTLAYAFGSMALTYSLTFLAHQLSGVFLGSALIVLWWWKERRLARVYLAAMGMLGGWAILTDYQAAFGLVPIGVLFLLWAGNRDAVPQYPTVGSGYPSFVAVMATRLSSVRWRLFAANCLIAAVGFAIPVAILLVYHKIAFGGALTTGYHINETYSVHHESGFLGLDYFRPNALLGSTFSPDNGLFTFAPFLLLFFPGTVLLWQKVRWRGIGVTCLAIAVIYLLFVSSISMWRSHWQLGPRYIVVVLPFLLPAVAVALARANASPESQRMHWVAAAIGVMTFLVALLVGPYSLATFYGLSGAFVFAVTIAAVMFPGLRLPICFAAILASVVIYTTSSTLFPHFPDRFASPFAEVTLRLIRDDAGPYSLGYALGLPGGISLWPMWGAVLALAIHAMWRIHRSASGIVCAVILAAAWLAVIANVRGGNAADDRAYKNYVLGSMPDR